MKKFDLEAAKRGAAVCTRDGHPARIIAYDGKWLGRFVLIVLVDYGGREVSYNYRLCGSAYADGGTDSDLMMRDDDYLEKLERGEYQSGQIRPLYKNPSISMGLTKREWFAGMAIGAVTNVLIAPNDEAIARYAVGIADALISELDKTEK